jgi:hypothetical protein
MSAGSEQLSWTQYPGVPHICVTCGRPLRIADVARVHSSVIYRNGIGRTTTVFYCVAHRREGYGAA